MLGREPRPLGFWQLGHVSPHSGNESLIDEDRQEIRIREVTVVVRLFLAAHRTGFVAVGIVEARFLDHLAAAFQHLDLAINFVKDCALQKAEGIEVLGLCARAELISAGAPHRDVGVTAK